MHCFVIQVYSNSWITDWCFSPQWLINILLFLQVFYHLMFCFLLCPAHCLLTRIFSAHTHFAKATFAFRITDRSKWDLGIVGGLLEVVFLFWGYTAFTNTDFDSNDLWCFITWGRNITSKSHQRFQESKFAKENIWHSVLLKCNTPRAIRVQ